jgi:hypothetical protein
MPPRIPLAGPSGGRLPKQHVPGRGIHLHVHAEPADVARQHRLDQRGRGAFPPSSSPSSTPPARMPPGMSWPTASLSTAITGRGDSRMPRLPACAHGPAVCRCRSLPQTVSGPTVIRCRRQVVAGVSVLLPAHPTCRKSPSHRTSQTQGFRGRFPKWLTRFTNPSPTPIHSTLIRRQNHYLHNRFAHRSMLCLLIRMSFVKKSLLLSVKPEGSHGEPIRSSWIDIERAWGRGLH